MDTLSLSRTQFVIVCSAFVAHLVFIPSVSHFVRSGTWGGGVAGMSWQLPDPQDSILGVPVSSYTLITCHAAAALLLAAALFRQFVLARRGVPSARLVAVHRAMGPVILCTLLPAFLTFALALIGLRRGDRDLHADSMFLAPNGEPVDAGALLRTVIVLAVLALGFWSCHRLRRNLLPMAMIAGVLVGALAFLPWSLDSAPA